MTIKIPPPNRIGDIDLPEDNQVIAWREQLKVLQAQAEEIQVKLNVTEALRRMKSSPDSKYWRMNLQVTDNKGSIIEAFQRAGYEAEWDPDDGIIEVRAPPTAIEYEELARKQGIRWTGQTVPFDSSTTTRWECSKGHKWNAHFRKQEAGYYVGCGRMTFCPVSIRIENGPDVFMLSVSQKERTLLMLLGEGVSVRLDVNGHPGCRWQIESISGNGLRECDSSEYERISTYTHPDHVTGRSSHHFQATSVGIHEIHMVVRSEGVIVNEYKLTVTVLDPNNKCQHFLK